MIRIGGVWEAWLQRASGDASEKRVPLFGGRPAGVEFQPPEKLRPGQSGLLLDECADTLDITATIVDLAMRGNLTITVLDKTWWFGSRDWQPLTRLSPPR
jgi:hypothetical protein